MYLITPEQNIEKEQDLIHYMLNLGVQGLHIRKPFFTQKEMYSYLRAIDYRFSSQLVLHSHYELAKDFGIHRLHAPEYFRKKQDFSLLKEGWQWSTSVHDITDFNSLEPFWHYAFISPIFSSISKKGYGGHSPMLLQLKQRTNFYVKMIALGGIDLENRLKAIQHGADDVAFLGTVWESIDPLITFLKCKESDHL